jgi:tetratricopeptide (TPR) repeat protein
MRGVGKTQLAAAFARAKIDAGWRLVAWVSAEESAGLLAGLTEVAGVLGLPAADGAAAGRAVRHWLEAGGQECLLVFDNATDPVVLRPFIPAVGAARVIITSNEQSMRYLGAGVAVEVFTQAEALAFLAERTGLAEPAGAGRIAAELGFLPLALAQAAAVIAEQRLGYGTYLGRLRGLTAGELLRAEEAGQYPRGVAAAVLLALEGVRAQDGTGVGAAVMELLAVLSPGGVRRTMIHAAAQRGVLGGGQGDGLRDDMTDRALARLAGASLLTFSVDGQALTAHRLTMRVIREQLTARGALTGTCGAAAKLLDELADSLSRSWHEDRAAVRDLVEQVVALYEASTACPDDAALTSSLFRLRWRAVWFLNSLGDSAGQSIGIAEPLLADQERLLGTSHPETLKTRISLASAYQFAGRAIDAITLNEQNLTDCERVLGTDHPDTLRTSNNLANAYRVAGRATEAITLNEQNLTNCERVLGTDHPDTLATRNNLALSYQAAGRVTEAITLHQQNLADHERVLGSDHPQTLRNRISLALAYQDAGRLTEAITLHQRNLTEQGRVLGTDHPETLMTRGSLALAYQDAGRVTEAITLHQQNLADFERVLGTDHPDTARSRNNLAKARRADPDR